MPRPAWPSAVRREDAARGGLLPDPAAGGAGKRWRRTAPPGGGSGLVPGGRCAARSTHRGVRSAAWFGVPAAAGRSRRRAVRVSAPAGRCAAGDRPGGVDPGLAPGWFHGHLRRAAGRIQPRPAAADSARLPRRRIRRGGSGVPVADQDHRGGGAAAGRRLAVLLLFPCLSRWAMLLAMSLFPYVRRAGAGTPFTGSAGGWRLLAGTGTAAFAGVLLAGWWGLALMALAGGVGCAVGIVARVCWAA